VQAAIYNGPYAIEVGERPDPRIQEPTDAVVRVVLGSVCGSDLWYYRGQSAHALGPIGHEFIGVVDEVGPAVTTLQRGDLVVAPFTFLRWHLRELPRRLAVQLLERRLVR
jgi:threonine dehydrogenase-like Zn-dependent dehydrogenase